jgi:P-type conjugative transfer protein TrbG
MMRVWKLLLSLPLVALGGPSAAASAEPLATVPYSESSVPTLQCAPLRACSIALEPGEVLRTKMLGDSERWQVALSPATPNLVAVKPGECDLTTNLILATDRRTYQILLVSRCGKGGAEAPDADYTGLLRFTYPDKEFVSSPALLPAATAACSTADPTTLNFAYRLRLGRGFPWRPEHVFDDGTHLYVPAPASSAVPEPNLYAIQDGEESVLNFVRRGGYLVTDRLVDRLTLRLPSPRPKRQGPELRIERIR